MYRIAGQDIDLMASGSVSSVPTQRADNGDSRMSIEPDVPIALSSAAASPAAIRRPRPHSPSNRPTSKSSSFCPPAPLEGGERASDTGR